jgi:acetyltransferase
MEKKTRAFIILSAGFGEEGPEGKLLEKKIADVISSVDGCLIGPNCIGFLNSNYNGVFTTPIPALSKTGVDFISGSGATAVFIMESAIPNGLPFSSVYSVGNSAQTGVEDVLQYLDENYIEGESTKVKILYIENIDKPAKLFKHASSLIRKGCRIAAIKSGSSEAGSRAASSHTGALASSDMAVDALFSKAGIVRCNSRSELTAVASVFMHPLPVGRRIGIVTHAGGPAVMLTDALSKGGFEIPVISGPKAEKLRTKLFPGSSVSNPIDFLATGTAEQLGEIIDACENDFDNIDAIAVIFGSPGLFPVDDVYDLLHERMTRCKKPIFPILPSVINVRREIERFISRGNINFPDEVVFGNALSRVLNTRILKPEQDETVRIDKERIRSIIENEKSGYLSPESVSLLLDAAAIPRVPEKAASTADMAAEAASSLGFPVVMKVIGPIHKSDVGGVALNLTDSSAVRSEFLRMKEIDGFSGVLIQKMIGGTELFAGVKAEGAFGHLLLAGLGGIFIEVLKDFSVSVVPVNFSEAIENIRCLKGYSIIKGARGKMGVDEHKYAEVIVRLSLLVEAAPEIEEMDINPLMGYGEHVLAVDARVRINRKR